MRESAQRGSCGSWLWMQAAYRDRQNRPPITELRKSLSGSLYIILLNISVREGCYRGLNCKNTVSFWNHQTFNPWTTLPAPRAFGRENLVSYRNPSQGSVDRVGSLPRSLPPSSRLAYDGHCGGSNFALRVERRGDQSMHAEDVQVAHFLCSPMNKSASWMFAAPLHEHFIAGFLLPEESEIVGGLVFCRFLLQGCKRDRRGLWPSSSL